MVRKAQYMYGWDWGPVLRGCGIWQPVELVTVPTARIRDWQYDAAFNDDGSAAVSISVSIERSAYDLKTELICCPGIISADSREMPGELCGFAPQVLPSADGTIALRFTATIAASGVRRWWPNGHGPENAQPSLCGLSISLYTAEQIIVERLDAQIGLRTVELIHDPDADGKGEGFKFCVNGHDIFVKGANWIPNDSFPATISEEELRERILQARDAGFNMLRVWGGGFYESEHFYELCDNYGLLVWQDFPYACAYYPDTGAYAEAVRSEATAAVQRIRNHPCLALWCGNNENSMMYYSNWHGAKPERYVGEHIYNSVLPEVLAQHDPRTPYWPSSPFGGKDPNSPTHGDCHNWDVWHGRGDWVHYTENDSRFCSEFGFASSCGLAAWDTVLTDIDKRPLSPAVRWHDKTRKGYDTYLKYIGLHYPDPRTMEDLVYYSQINQAEALKFGIEHYRRRKGHCWGTLFWQLNDCWPVQSWSIIDYLGEPKAAYYAAKRFYAPVLLSLVKDGDTIIAHIVNDHPHAVAGSLSLTVASLDGTEALDQRRFTVQVGPNGVEVVATFPLPATASGRERDLFVHGTFQPGEEGEPVDNLMLLAEPKDLCLSDPGLQMTVTRGSAASFIVSITAQRFAPYVWLRRHDNGPLEVDDNFFHLTPGEIKDVTVYEPDDAESIEQMRSLLMLRSL